MQIEVVIGNIVEQPDVQALVNTQSAKSGAGATVTQAQDRFLKILVTQMQNQDPMNPMDNAQVTTQLAQIQTVTGVGTLNNSIQSLSGQFQQMQALQSVSLVGRDVTVPGNKVAVADGNQRATIEWAPSASREVRYAATPAFTARVASTVVPSRNSTLPCGVGVLGSVTAALSVTISPVTGDAFDGVMLTTGPVSAVTCTSAAAAPVAPAPSVAVIDSTTSPGARGSAAPGPVGDQCLIWV